MKQGRRYVQKSDSRGRLLFDSAGNPIMVPVRNDDICPTSDEVLLGKPLPETEEKEKEDKEKRRW